MTERSIAGWFAVPVRSMERVMVLDETVFSIELPRNHMGSPDMAVFLDSEGNRVAIRTPK